MKILNKREIQQIALTHSLDIDFRDFIKIYKKLTAQPYSFLLNDTTLPTTLLSIILIGRVLFSLKCYKSNLNYGC